MSASSRIFSCRRRSTATGRPTPRATTSSSTTPRSRTARWRASPCRVRRAAGGSALPTSSATSPQGSATCSACRSSPWASAPPTWRARGSRMTAIRTTSTCPASAGGTAVYVDDPGEQGRGVGRFTLPGQAGGGGVCVAYFLRGVASGERDVLGLQSVTMGQRASDVARAWFKDDRYQDYLYLHGLGVEMAEALAEYDHKRIRGELGFGHEDARDLDAMLDQGYRGSRYSFGYPACPQLEDQEQLLRLLQRSEEHTSEL